MALIKQHLRIWRALVIDENSEVDRQNAEHTDDQRNRRDLTDELYSDPNDQRTDYEQHGTVQAATKQKNSNKAHE